MIEAFAKTGGMPLSLEPDDASVSAAVSFRAFDAAMTFGRTSMEIVGNIRNRVRLSN